MQSIDDYRNLDLEALRQPLLDGIEAEAQLASISLTGKHDDSVPADGLTPHAVLWFNRHIASKRGTALSALRRQAAAVIQDGGAPGSCPDLDIDHAEIARWKALKEATEVFCQKNSRLTKDLEEKEQSYRQQRSLEGGREAKVANPWLEYGSMLLVVIPESLLNFGAFQKAPFIGSDFMALGATLLVALGVAVASHFVGLFIRQFNYYNRGRDGHRSSKGWSQLALGLGILLIALVVVGAARYYYVKPTIEQAILLGTTPPNLVLSVASMLGGNLLVFLIGVGLTYFQHDENPEYEEAARSRVKLRKQVEKLKRKQLDGKIRDADKRLASDRNDIERKSRSILVNPAYGNVRNALDVIRVKDKEVISLLQEYRLSLGQGMQQQRPNFKFITKDYAGDPLHVDRELPIDVYMSRNIHLHYNTQG
jgi:uncharacterized membrane protein YidH (DUF202 family)